MSDFIEPHVHYMSVFDCPRVRVVRDGQSGCLALHFGRITINVYGRDPYNVVPELIEQTEEESSKESLGIGIDALEASRESPSV